MEEHMHDKPFFQQLTFAFTSESPTASRNRTCYARDCAKCIHDIPPYTGSRWACPDISSCGGCASAGEVRGRCAWYIVHCKMQLRWWEQELMKGLCKRLRRISHKLLLLQHYLVALMVGDLASSIRGPFLTPCLWACPFFVTAAEVAGQ